LAKLSNREKAEIVYSLSGQHDLDLLLKIIGLPRSSYYYARKHPKAATRPDVHEKVKEIFNRTSNGCGHRQIFMRLRREFNIVIAKKTVLGSVRISVSGEVIPGAAQRGCPLYLRCSMPDLMR
jgi:hypothetical protein